MFNFLPFTEGTKIQNYPFLSMLKIQVYQERNLIFVVGQPTDTFMRICDPGINASVRESKQRGTLTDSSIRKLHYARFSFNHCIMAVNKTSLMSFIKSLRNPV